MSRSTTVWQLLFVATYACLADRAIAQQAPAHSDVVIKNAIVMTATHGNLKNGSVYTKEAKIAAVGVSVDAPPAATVIDAGGKYLTPGIVAAHPHLALEHDVTDATSP